MIRVELRQGKLDCKQKKKNESRITAAEVKFLGRTTECARLDCKMNLDITKESDAQSVVELIEKYKDNLKKYVLRMPRSRIPFLILGYQPNGRRSSRRPEKRWHETVGGHWA